MPVKLSKRTVDALAAGPLPRVDYDVELKGFGVRLGAINHALLSARAIRADGCGLAGWIANRIDPDMPYADDTIATIAARIDAPLLGTLAWNDAAPMLDVHAL